MRVALVIFSAIAKAGYCRLELIFLSGLRSRAFSLSEMFATTGVDAGPCARDESIRERIGWLFVIPRTFRRTTTESTWPTLRERAEIVWIKLESGTEVELIVPGSVAYDVPTQPSGAIASTDSLTRVSKRCVTELQLLCLGTCGSGRKIFIRYLGRLLGEIVSRLQITAEETHLACDIAHQQRVPILVRELAAQHH